jgi:hypothetical protein
MLVSHMSMFLTSLDSSSIAAILSSGKAPLGALPLSDRYQCPGLRELQHIATVTMCAGKHGSLVSVEHPALRGSQTILQ